MAMRLALARDDSAARLRPTTRLLLVTALLTFRLHRGSLTVPGCLYTSHDDFLPARFAIIHR